MPTPATVVLGPSVAVVVVAGSWFTFTLAFPLALLALVTAVAALRAAAWRALLKAEVVAAAFAAEEALLAAASPPAAPAAAAAAAAAAAVASAFDPALLVLAGAAAPAGAAPALLVDDDDPPSPLLVLTLLCFRDPFLPAMVADADENKWPDINISR